MLIALTLAVAIGLSLGLLGSGGSILTLPAMVYGAGVSEHDAVPMSLAVVGVTAGAGAVMQAVKGQVDWRGAGLFAAGGAVGAVPGGYLSSYVPGAVLMLAFAAIMIVVGIQMLRGRSAEVIGPRRALLPALAAGAGVGGLTAFLGAGGGFLVVPALERFLGLALPRAMATSLVVIAANCAAGLVVHGGNSDFDWPLTFSFAALALVGMTGGLLLARRIPVRGLRLAFGWFVLLMAAFVLFENRDFFIGGPAAGLESNS